MCVYFAEGCVGSGLELMGNASSLRLPIEAILGAGRGGLLSLEEDINLTYLTARRLYQLFQCNRCKFVGWLTVPLLCAETVILRLEYYV